mmetsp:Transcript_27141/g.24015  ORF Transcript_27141/g.24015 Transcript_27141/m.24015 type:complete len:91 (-) Transcript_27141:30-302(-)
MVPQNLMVPQNEGVKLIRPIPKRTSPPLAMPSSVKAPMGGIGVGTNNVNGGFDNPLGMRTNTLPINNLIYLLNQSNTTQEAKGRGFWILL